MSLCPHCKKEISYMALDKDIIGKSRLPLIEISCSQCKTVINVVMAPDYYLDAIQSLKDS